MIGIEKRKFAAAVFLSIFGVASLSGVDVSPDHRKIGPMLLVMDDPAPVFIHMKSDDPDLPARLGNLGGNGRRITPRLYTGRIPRDAARYVSNWPQVSYIEGARRARPLLDLSGPAVSADIVQAGTGLPASYTGAGMYVGVVDTGLDNSHLDFHTGGTGSPHRIAHWYPDPLSASWDTDGHGTHVTGIVAGNGFMSSGTYTGMAPAAEILFGMTSFYTTDVVTAVQDLVSFAETNSKPIPVNLSLGLMVGPHDGTSAFESAIDSLATGTPGSKRLVVVAAGNETGWDEHFQANVAPFGAASATIDLYDVSRSISQGDTVEFWADGNDQYGISIALGTDAISVPAGSSGTSTGGRITVSNGVASPPNGATLISIFFTTGSGTASIQLTRTRNGGTGRVDGYIDYWDGAFASATDPGTIIEPANGSAVLAVGSYDIKTFGGSSAPQAISSFSSLGPTRDGRLKPDITAPGQYIFSTRSFDAPSSNYDGIVSGNSNYAILRGTSMATPHVTGIAALIWQSNPALTGAQMRERIRRTANAPTDGSTPPNNTWGHGKVNALAAVRNSVASITAPATALPGAPVSITSDNSSAAFAGNSLSYAWSLVSRPSGSGASLSSTTASSTGFTPDNVGNYTVGLTVSQATPSGTPAGSDNATIHVNTVPGAPSITGPAYYDNLSPVSFHGSGSDPDGQSLTYRWVLVSRPSGSSAFSASPYFTANGDNVVLAPDAAGAYVVGLKVDDGLDNSALALHTFNASGSPPSSGGGGGGGCSIANRVSDEGNLAPIATVVLLLSPAGFLAVRRRSR
ncbi:MAG: S8 family serine peptidase [Deltaproteobacteria bacterium]|nr:S8 family serine peptidase [Deltaproteobacteria bacterium]